VARKTVGVAGVVSGIVRSRIGRESNKIKNHQPEESVANAGHRATALRLCAPEIETVVVDGIVKFPLVVKV
jgi:hypothetical protein